MAEEEDEAAYADYYAAYAAEPAKVGAPLPHLVPMRAAVIRHTIDLPVHLAPDWSA